MPRVLPRLSLPFWFVAGLIGMLLRPASAWGYGVEIKREADFARIKTHCSAAQKPDSNLAEAVSWASFTLREPVAVRVTVPAGRINKARILPSSKAIVVEVRDGAAYFTLRQPGQFYLEINGESKHPLFLFADAPEQDPPAANDPDVIYFAPGEHHLGENFIEPRPGQTVYLAPGSVVHGRIRLKDAPRVTIRGRGILRGGHLPANPPDTYTVPHAIEADQASSRVTVEGITMVESPHYQILLRGEDCVVRNVKLLGWWFGTDGIGTGPRGLVEDSFLRCNDDALKLYHRGMVVRRCVIWQMENGAPFQLSWNLNQDNAGFRVSDIDIIAVDHHQEANNRAIFNSIHGGRAHLRDYLFENIRIENAHYRLLLLQIRKTNWSKAAEWGRLSGITLRNITADGPFSQRSAIRSDHPAGRIEDVRFENVRIGGRVITTAADLELDADPASTAGIRFNP